MKRFRVIVSTLAKERIRAQVIFIAQDSIENALAWEDRLLASIESIGDMPTGFPIDATSTRRMGNQIRKMVFERTYLVFFRIDEISREVQVLNFRHGAQLPRRDEP